MPAAEPPPVATGAPKAFTPAQAIESAAPDEAKTEVAPTSTNGTASVFTATASATSTAAATASVSSTSVANAAAPAFGSAGFALVADSCTMQGRRPKQEDRHVKIPDLTKAAKALKMPIDHLDQPCALFGVYDGHQGSHCSEFVAKNVHMKLLKKLSADRKVLGEDQIKQYLQEVCEEIDTDFLAKHRTIPDGAAIVVAFLTGTRLFVAWVGDSRAVMCRRTGQEEFETVALTKDHKPDLEVEAQRVQKAGGVVVSDAWGMTYRVAHPGYEERMREMKRAEAQGLGIIGKEPVALAVSRAIGDREFKSVTGKQLLIPTPDVTCIRIDRSVKFIALMCDGIPEVMTNEQVVGELAFVRESLDFAADVRAGCGALVQEAYKLGSGDNLTVILVRFRWEGVSDMEGSSLSKLGQTIEKRPLEESAAAASKRRRLEAVASAKAQRSAAHEAMEKEEEEREKALTKAKADAIDAAKQRDDTVAVLAKTSQPKESVEVKRDPLAEVKAPAATPMLEQEVQTDVDGKIPEGEEPNVVTNSQVRSESIVEPLAPFKNEAKAKAAAKPVFTFV